MFMPFPLKFAFPSLEGRISFPWNKTIPPVILAGGMSSTPIIAWARVDFPDPLSPTTPTTSSLPTLIDTSLRTSTDLSTVSKLTVRPLTSRRFELKLSLGGVGTNI
jgi:hypothetical protein